MALIHRATIRPTKAELLDEWVPTQPWGEPGLEIVGAFRFDDPDGEVGIETHVVVTAGGHLLQIPLTYRGAPLVGADPFLVCTMEHSVLGRRWIYDATGDPVYAQVLASVLSGRAAQADEYVEGVDAPREPSVRVTSGGTSGRDLRPDDTDVSAAWDASTTVVEAGGLRIVLCRRLAVQGAAAAHELTLTGTWSGGSEPFLLAYVA
ncbi:CG0192-related protein [Cellulomonas sp. McL0617]|uniref:CG0192-related protein n=1 Tax=Cellulomonas sp. McL0617 TaxID=3415675 RepID=UPI003CF82CFD